MMRLLPIALVCLASLCGPAASSAGIAKLTVVANTGEEDYGEVDNVDYRPAISADGRFVAYVSFNTDPGDPLLLRDLRRRTTTVVASTKSERLEGTSNQDPVLSATGRYLAFSSDEPDLSDEDRDHVPGTGSYPVVDVFVYDRRRKTTKLVSRRSGRHGAPAESNSTRPSISAGGRIIAFTTSASNLAPPEPITPGGVYQRDLLTERTLPVSAPPGIEFWHPASFSPDVSGDGRRVAFGYEFARWPWPKGAPLGVAEWLRARTKQVMLRDSLWPRPRLVSRADGADGAVPNDRCIRPSVSHTGRFVAFACKGTNLVPGDRNGFQDVFVRDVKRQRTFLVSAPGRRPTADGDSDAPSISADGRYVAFASLADNLVPGDRDGGKSDVFLKDLKTGSLTHLSPGLGGEPSNGRSANPVLTPKGRFVVYATTSSNITPADPSRDMSIYRVRLRP
jgi:Tol biopolymer transport system component